MNLFETLNNEDFFKPLSGKNKHIYFECIVRLIERSKQVPVLYESDARDCITLYLNNCNYALQEDEEGILVDSPNDIKASYIMKYLCHCGWLVPRELGRNGENISGVTIMCRRVISYLVKLCNKSNEGKLSNNIISMYEIMKSVSENDSIRLSSPYTHVIVPMQNNMEELKNELMDLKENISIIMRAVIEFNDANSIGNYINKDEMLAKFFDDYFFIKRNGIIPSYISFITIELRKLLLGDLLEKIVDEYVEKKSVDKQEAKELIEDEINNLISFVAYEYDENIEAIDRRINDYYNLANTRIMLTISNGTNIQSLINTLLTKMKNMDKNKKEKIFNEISECVQICSQKYIGTKSFERRKKPIRVSTPMGIEVDVLTDEEKEKRTQELMKKTSNRYSIDKVIKFLSSKEFVNGKMSLRNQKIDTKEEAIMYVASIVYSGHKGFPYKVKIQEECINTNVAEISDIVIAKEEK